MQELQAGPQSPPDIRAPAGPWLRMLAVFWMLGFSYLFYTAELPNASTGEHTLTRADVAQVLWSDLSWLSPFSYPKNEIPSGWEYFGQRLPHLGTAVLLWTAAWLIGRVLTSRLLDGISLLRSEQFVIEAAAGMSAFTLWVLSIGVCGIVGESGHTLLLLGPSFVCAVWLMIERIRRSSVASERPVGSVVPRYLLIPVLLIGIPFLLHLILGAASPPFDFDVREYHLQGPKEWFLAGRISELRHNVYTSFPFLSEMVSLAAMQVRGEWFLGALSGKMTLAGFQILSILASYAIATRWFNRSAGVIAATAVLSTPWIIRISVIAYAEGAITLYLTATVMVALLAGQTQNLLRRLRLVGVAGFLAGSGMAAKYPGLLTIIIPVGLFLAWRTIQMGSGDSRSRTTFIRTAAVYVAGTLIAMGPWMLKNVIAEGNPVYPLAWSVFGADDWSPEMEAKWQAGHSAPDHDVSGIARHIASIAVDSDWQSGILFALAVPALVLLFRNRQLRSIGMMLVWLIGTWWAFTHRIDRFWIPLIPLLSVAAGTLWQAGTGRVWHGILLGVIVVGGAFNYGLARTDLIGRHAGLTDLEELSKAVVRPDLQYLNNVLKSDARVLMVGEAEVFDAQFPLIYNTVFDDSIFELWTSAAESGVVAARQPLRPAAEILAKLRGDGVTHVFVNWAEILRYRKTYGYTEYVYPARFQQLVEAGVLGERSVPGVGELSPEDQELVRSWPGGAQLIHENLADLYVLYRVR